MKKIGMVGGTSWSSTVDYYRYINEETNRRLGGLQYAECMVYSVNFDKFRSCNAAHRWDDTRKLLSDAALNLKAAGAEIIMLCANTSHVVADLVAADVQLPLIDIRTATAHAIREQGLQKLGLLGTVFTMQMPFYKEKLAAFGIECLVPESDEDIAYIEGTLVNELGKGILLDSTRSQYLRIIKQLTDRGAEGIILGCTEIPLLIEPGHVDVPVFNTTLIHARAAVAYALDDNL